MSRRWNRPIAEPTSVSRVVPTRLPSRQSNTQWNGLLRDMVDAALFRIGRQPPPSVPVRVSPRVRTLLAAYRQARKVTVAFEAKLKRLGFGTDGQVHYQTRQKAEATRKERHEARIRATQAIRAAALTELIGTMNPRQQRVILRATAKRLERV